MTYLKFLKLEKFIIVKPSFKIGLNAFINSLLLTCNSFFDLFKQQGIRFLIGGIGNISQMTIFTTIRTGANVFNQGLSTITNPLMPELMRFINNKDQDKFEASFSLVWFVIICLLCPSILIIQGIIEPIFLVWTLHKMQFNSILFATLSLSVLIYGLAQPAISVVTGNNLLKPQIVASIITTSIVISTMFLLLPKVGIVGAGFSLLIADIISLLFYNYHAKVWLNSNGLRWPKEQFNIVLLQVIMVFVSISFVILYDRYKYIIIILSLLFQAYNILRYWKSLPLIVHLKVQLIIKRMFFFAGHTYH